MMLVVLIVEYTFTIHDISFFRVMLCSYFHLKGQTVMMDVSIMYKEASSLSFLSANRMSLSLSQPRRLPPS